MSSSNLVRLAFIKEASYGVTPPAVKAVKAIQDLTYTADAYGEDGNSITVAYTGGGTAGSEVVTVVGSAISVQIQSGVSTATQVKAAVDASVAASALISVAITGVGATAQVTVAATNLLLGFGDMSTARFTSESLSGTPETVESEQIRTDRQSSGQVVVGINVGGDLNFELAKEAAIDEFLESALYSTWQTPGAVTVDLTINASTKKISRGSGSFITEGVKVGRLLKFTGFTNAANNAAQVMVTAVGALEIDYVGPDTLISEAGGGTTYKICDYLEIGTTKKSFSMEKAFLDLTTKAINYRGMIVNNLSLNFAYGELATGSFGLLGNDHVSADAASEFMSYQRNIDAPATSQTMNGSVDMPFLATDIAGGLMSTSGLDIQSVGITLENNLNAQNVIGDVAPRDYSAGTAKVGVEIGVYNNNGSWASLDKRLTQSSIKVGFQVKNTDGYYSVFMPAVQLTFEDPASGGQNQDILLNMSGVAKVGSSGESAITISRS